jgi:pimeloyl-ACP methyl ester carboxylesterase
VQSYTRPAQESAAVRRDVAKILRGISARHTQAAAEKLPDFGKPAIVIWAAEDKLFPTALGHRLADCLSAEYVEIPDSYTFIAEDQPQALADVLRRFLVATAELTAL